MMRVKITRIAFFINIALIIAFVIADYAGWMDFGSRLKSTLNYHLSQTGALCYPEYKLIGRVFVIRGAGVHPGFHYPHAEINFGLIIFLVSIVVNWYFIWKLNRMLEGQQTRSNALTYPNKTQSLVYVLIQGVIGIIALMILLPYGYAVFQEPWYWSVLPFYQSVGILIISLYVLIRIYFIIQRPAKTSAEN